MTLGNYRFSIFQRGKMPCFEVHLENIIFKEILTRKGTNRVLNKSLVSTVLGLYAKIYKQFPRPDLLYLICC